ncbi:MAG: LptF/LptG family permease [Candidatus Muirbacterium halophilum]|nr:LptF/LptG family permease [Candidatus Muirbacterium halophilum]MCK9477237.1 LptF/LptG family permease [Candidatus Muirbacterium halophilum]
MVKILDRYIFKSLFGPFVFGVLSFLIIMAIDPLYNALSYIIIRGKPTSIVLKWFGYKMLSKDLIFVFPMSVLMSTLIVMGNFSKLSEVTAMKSGGISFFRIVRPVMVFTFFVSIMTFVVYEKIVPNAIEQEEIYKTFKLQNMPRFITKENIFLREDKDKFLYIRRVNFYNRTFNYLMLYYIEDGLLKKTLASRTGRINKDDTWILEQGSENTFDENGFVSNVQKFTNRELKLNNTLIEIENFDKEDPDAMTFIELYRKIKNLAKHGVLNLNKYLVALYQKTAMPFSCMIFGLVGAAMGTTSKRSGTFTNLGLSVIMIFVYYVLMSFLKSYGEAGRILPIFATWMPNLMFLVFGIFLASKVKN